MTDDWAKRMKISGLVLLTAITLLGLGALVPRFWWGLRTANFSSLAPWGLWLAIYIYFIGLSAGSFLISSLVYVFGIKQFKPVGRLALVQAMCCLVIGMTFIGNDLGRPERGYRTLTNWSWTSVMAWEVLFYVAYMAVLALEIWLLSRPDLEKISKKARRPWVRKLYGLAAAYPGGNEGEERPDPAASPLLRGLAIAGVPLALGVHGGTGLIFAVLKARPYWYTGLFPIIFIVSALVSGGALLTFLSAVFLKMKKEEKLPLIRRLATLTGAILIVDVSFLFIETVVALYGNVPDHAIPYHLILAGPFWWVFWILQIALGTLIPLLLIFGPGRNSLKWLGTACALIVVGIVGVRWNIVTPPLQFTWVGGLPEAFHHAISDAGYVPSLNEWLTTFGLLGAGVWGFLIVRHVLPMQSVETEEEA